MADINKCILTGRIGNTPELRSTSSGTSTCAISLAVERPKAKDAQEAETDWLELIAWRGTAEFCARYLAKGRKVVVECSARTRKWNDKDGKTHKVVEFVIQNIIPADSKPQNAGVQQPPAPKEDDFTDITADDGDLPF